MEQVLEQLRTVSAAMREDERRSARECMMRALSMLHLQYPSMDVRRITVGIPRGLTEADECAAEEHVADVVDNIVADLDLGDEE